MRSIILIFGVVAILSAGAITAEAAEPYIQLEDSTIIRGCEMKVHRALQSIMLFCGGEEKRVLFRDVLKIVDSSGADVTDDYIGRYDTFGGGDQEPDTLSKPLPEGPIRRDSERLFSSTLSGQILIRTNVSGTFTDADAGFGIQVSSVFTTSTSAGIRLKLSHSRAHLDGWPGDYESTQFTAGFFFFNGNARQRKGKGFEYAHFGLGLTYESPKSISLFSRSSVSGSRFTVTSGLGWIQIFSDRVGLDSCLGIDMLFGRGSNSVTNPSIQIELRLGLVGLFGGY